MPEHPLWQPPGLPWYDVDINVNAHHPAGEVTLLEPSVVEDLLDVHLPSPVTNFVTRRQLRCVSVCYKVEIIIVLYVLFASFLQVFLFIYILCTYSQIRTIVRGWETLYRNTEFRIEKIKSVCFTNRTLASFELS